jgi:hypothetical protein
MPGRLIDHDNPRPRQLHITGKPEGGPRIRALLVQDTAPAR